MIKKYGSIQFQLSEKSGKIWRARFPFQSGKIWSGARLENNFYVVYSRDAYGQGRPRAEQGSAGLGRAVESRPAGRAWDFRSGQINEQTVYSI